MIQKVLRRAISLVATEKQEYCCLCKGIGLGGVIAEPLRVSRSIFSSLWMAFEVRRRQNALYSEVSSDGRASRTEYELLELYEDERQGLHRVVDDKKTLQASSD